MTDDLMVWAYSPKIREKILASTDFVSFIMSCEGWDSHMASYARMEPAYWTVKRFPTFNEQKMCAFPQATKLTDFIYEFTTQKFKAGPSQPYPLPVYLNDDSTKLFTGLDFLESVFVRLTPNFRKNYYEKYGCQSLAIYARNFGGETKWVALYGTMKFGSDLLLTYLDTTTEALDVKTSPRVFQLENV